MRVVGYKNKKEFVSLFVASIKINKQGMSDFNLNSQMSPLELHEGEGQLIGQISSDNLVNPPSMMVMQSEPSQISLKQIAQMFTNEEARKMTQAIKSANRDMVLQTKDFEKELHSLENAKVQAQKDRKQANKNMREDKRRLRLEQQRQIKQDFLNVIATPESNSRRAESIKSFGTAKSILNEPPKEMVPEILPKRKRKPSPKNSGLKLPEISSASRNKQVQFNTVAFSSKKLTSVRARSQINGQQQNKLSPILMQNQGDPNSSFYQKEKQLVSFGRRVIPANDRVAERKLIIEKRKRLDMLIASGLKSAGIELDAEEKRIQAMLESTSSSMQTPKAGFNQQAFLPSLIEKQESVTIPLTEEGSSSQNVFEASKMSRDYEDDGNAFNDLMRKTDFEIEGSPKRLQRKKSKLGPLIKAKEVSVEALRAHQIELQVLRNRSLRLAQEEETKQRDSKNETKALFNMTMRATGTFYSVQSTATGAHTQWFQDGKFEQVQLVSEKLQKELLIDYSFAEDELNQFVDDPRLIALAQIKLMNSDQKNTAETEKTQQIKEMVGYLLNQRDQSEQVDIVTTRLLKKVYSQEYNQFTQDAYQLVSDYAFEVRDKKLFIDICKNASKPRLEANSKMNYLLKYYHECRAQGIVPLPILFKVRNKRLVLKGYGLNQGLCKSFATSLAIYPELLDGINFQNNGMSDSDLAITIKGLTKLTSLKVIILRNNIFMEQACTAITEILLRQVPNNLEEFRMTEMRTNPFIMSKLCATLAKNCHLRKLSLANTELSDFNVTELCELVKNARFLIEFDISSSKLTPPKMLELSRLLAENRTLQVINLSWNFFTQYFSMKDYKPGIDDIDEQLGDGQFFSEKDKLIMQDRDISKDKDLQKQGSMKELAGGNQSMMSMRSMSQLSTPSRAQTPRQGLPTVGSAQNIASTGNLLQLPTASDPTYADYRKRVYANYEFLLAEENASLSTKKINDEIVANISKMVKRNKALLHIDLSHTNLTEYMLWHVGKALSRARSVISVHLSGNQGITPTLKKQLLTRIRCKPENEYYKVGFELGIDPNDKMVRTQQGRFKKFDEQVVQERMKMRQIAKQQVDGDNGPEELNKDMSKLIFERKLGHKSDIPGSGQWKMVHRHHENCWVCANRIYALYFWQPSYGWKDSTVDPVLEENLIHQIEEINGGFEDEPIEEPSYFCEPTEWRPKKMRTLEDFFFDVDKSKPDFLVEMKNRKQCREEIENLSELNENEKEKYDELIRRYKMQCYQSSDDIKKIILRDLRFKHMQFFNAELLDNLDTGETDSEQNQIYVFAEFFPSGRQPLAIVIQDEEQDLQFFTHKLVTLKRLEEVPNFQKQIRTTAIVRTFNKESSVFADWKEDGPNTAANCMEHDLELWHADKFIKDEDDLAKTHDVMRKYAKEIKNIFIQLASRSSFPQLGWIDFSVFSNKVELPDPKGQGSFGASQIDTQYIAANNGTHAVQFMDPSILMRYKFVEIIARIAQSKYTNQQRTSTTAEAVEKLMKEVILPKYQWEPWQEYRNEVCYTLEVNDILQANFEGIKGLVEHYYAPRKHYMSKKDCIQLFMKDSGVLLGEKETTYCYGMSKMTVEKESKSSIMYEKIQVCELCEMICRVADTKFKTQQTLSISQKIELILDELFVVTGYSRKEVNVVQEEQSESDDEY